MQGIDKNPCSTDVTTKILHFLLKVVFSFCKKNRPKKFAASLRARLRMAARQQNVILQYWAVEKIDQFSLVELTGKGLIQMSKRVRNSLQVRVSQTGIISLPQAWMKENNIKAGDMLTLIDLNDGVVVMRRQESQFEKIAGKLAKELQDSGESLKSMLTTLHEVRAELDRKVS